MTTQSQSPSSSWSSPWGVQLRLSINIIFGLPLVPHFLPHQVMSKMTSSVPYKCSFGHSSSNNIPFQMFTNPLFPYNLALLLVACHSVSSFIAEFLIHTHTFELHKTVLLLRSSLYQTWSTFRTLRMVHPCSFTILTHVYG